ncbi:hypothetical protein [Peribacillus asahii]|uniref:hypothetical protein n=1 Tax=Peribacillus asahii TaxID=228899 RepID=UPI0038190150
MSAILKPYDIPEGYVQAVEVKDGLQLRVDKQWFVHHFLEYRSVEIQQMMLDFNVVVENVTTHEIFIRFEKK